MLRDLRLGTAIATLVIAFAVTVLLVMAYRSEQNARGDWLWDNYTCDSDSVQVVWGEYFCRDDITIMGY